LTLPAALCRPLPEMRRRLTDDAWRKNPRLRRWLRALEDAAPDLGFVYCGGWLPPRVFSLPSLGFVNFHPGPLPRLPGYFPEMFLALWGERRARGTLHRVSDEFDKGRILAYTPPVSLPRLATPKEIGARMTLAAAAALPGWLDRLAAGSLAPARRDRAKVFRASLVAVNQESAIDWESDDNARIERKARCFCAAPWDICQPLHARVAAGLRQVRDAETHGGDFPGAPGETLGVYRGEGVFRGGPAIRTRDGLAILRLGGPFRPGQRMHNPPDLRAGESRRRRTRLAAIEWLAEGDGRT
jgi:methionyl-tRNA formyltransferase